MTPARRARRRTVVARTTVVAGALAGALSGCGNDFAFRVDDRLTFTAPEDRSTVTLPVTLDWDIRDFEVVAPGVAPREGAGYFAVFIDEPPMPPGKPLSWLARDDAACRVDAGCPDEEYLNARGVHTTTETALVIDQLPAPPEGEQEERERHRATIVLLDSESRRIGESAFELQFDVRRGGVS